MSKINGDYTMAFVPPEAMSREPIQTTDGHVAIHFGTTAYMTDGCEVRTVQQDVALCPPQYPKDRLPLVRIELDSSMSKENAIIALQKVIDEIQQEGLPATWLSVPRGEAEKMVQIQQRASALYYGLPNLPPSIANAVRAHLDKGVSPKCRRRVSGPRS